jgi:hypothetical protein
MGITIDRRPRRQRLLEARLGRSLKEHILEEYKTGVRVPDIAARLNEMVPEPITASTIWGWIRQWKREQG